MKDITGFENYAVNNIIFLEFLKKAETILDKIPSNENPFEIFPKENKDNTNQYYSEYKRFFVDDSRQKSNIKKTLILEWVKKNSLPSTEKYDEDYLSSLIEESIFPKYSQTIADYHEKKIILIKLLSYHIINNLSNSIKFLFEIKNMYLKEKEKVIETNESYNKLFNLSNETENKLKEKISFLQKKINSLEQKINELSSKNALLQSERKVIAEENYGYTQNIQDYDWEIQNLNSKIKSLTDKIEVIEKANEAKIKEIKNESDNNYISLINIMNEFLDKFALDLSQKIEDTKNEMKEKLNKMRKK